VASLVLGIVGLSVPDDIAMMGGMLQDSILERACLAVYGLKFCGFTLAAPFGLSAFYSYPARVSGYLPLGVYLAPVALPAITWMAARVRTEQRLLAFGGLFIVIHMLLVLKAVPLGLEFAADRYLYVASIGLFIVAAELCRRAPVKCRLERQRDVQHPHP
jgi:hypothetical protein